LAFRQVREVKVAVQDLHVGRGRKVRRSNRAFAALVEAQHDRLVTVDLQEQVLQVQTDVLDVFFDAFDDTELVQDGVELDARRRGAGDRREQRAAKRVAERVAEAGVERSDAEGLTVAYFVAEGFDGGALDDQHGDSLRSGKGSVTWSTARR